MEAPAARVVVYPVCASAFLLGGVFPARVGKVFPASGVTKSGTGGAALTATEGEAAEGVEVPAALVVVPLNV